MEIKLASILFGAIAILGISYFSMIIPLKKRGASNKEIYMKLLVPITGIIIGSIVLLLLWK